ncbi:MAG: hypothetical protein H7268_07680 [Sandarakinorhabdus sp.]|nr:hypothetical protein [Sandarakinorhabdus sp.]
MNARAAAFLDRFRRADRDDALLDVLVDDYDGLAAAIELAPDEVLAIADAATVAAGPPADPHADSFASAACDRAGKVVVADPRFLDWLGGIDPLAAVVRGIGIDRPSVSAIADDRTGRPVAVAAATLAVARRWPLADAVRAALDNGTGTFAVVAFRPDTSAWEQATRAYGLSPQESRLAAALARRGDLKEAAAATGVSYETARKLVSNAMRKVGAARQTDLVRRILSAAAGDVRTPEGSTRLFADLFGLSMRQAALAQAVAHGATRDAAAAAIGASSQSAKAELKIVFQACGVANAVDLARIAAEVDALAGLATACSVAIEPQGETTPAEPLRLIARRRATGRIAVTDHGPAKSRPLLMFHTAVGGRHQPRRLVAALQAAGWRPISFDRPGYGLADMIDGPCPFAEAALDAADILDSLGIEGAALFSRTASAAALATAAAMPGRITGGILVAPDPPAHLDTRYVGMMGRGKALFFGNPVLAAAFARILSRRTSSAQIARMQRQSVAGSAIDEAAIDDPETLADIVRASRQAALGMRGFLAEMQAHGRGGLAPAVAAGMRWAVIAGANDPLYDFADSESHWREALPGADIEVVADGGRWLHLTHTDRVIAALARITG